MVDGFARWQQGNRFNSQLPPCCELVQDLLQPMRRNTLSVHAASSIYRLTPGCGEDLFTAGSLQTVGDERLEGSSPHLGCDVHNMRHTSGRGAARGCVAGRSRAPFASCNVLRPQPQRCLEHRWHRESWHGPRCLLQTTIERRRCRGPGLLFAGLAPNAKRHRYGDISPGQIGKEVYVPRQRSS